MVWYDHALDSMLRLGSIELVSAHQRAEDFRSARQITSMGHLQMEPLALPLA